MKRSSAEREGGRMHAYGRIVGTAAAGWVAFLAIIGPASPTRADGDVEAAPAQEAPTSSAPALERLPFAIRDGRIAQVSVHVVPFEPGRRELTPSAKAALERLVAAIATDCFLTAQAIGHARPDAPGEGDTLQAHELAQARSKLVQTLLARAGLPKDAVAALADYGFSLREPRVTLWVFGLAEGEECAGKSLARDRRPTAARPEPKPTPPRAAASLAPSPVEPAAAPPVAAGTPLASVAIAFEAKSTFLSPDAEGALKRLVKGLGKAPGYRFALEAGLGEAAPDSADPEMARRYRRWAAERRLARVTEWLQRNAAFRSVQVQGTLSGHEPGGRVTVRVHPLQAQEAAGSPSTSTDPDRKDGPGAGHGDRGRG
jgi:outer membrane protein OmpA-like peptidoglycan-associated protein